MHNTPVIGIIVATLVIASSIGIAFAQSSSMNSSTSVPIATSTNATQTNTTTQIQPSNSTSDQPRVITHAMGETIIAGTPQRVVVFSNNDYIEDVLALGVQPVGVAEPAKMLEQLIDLPFSLSNNVTDVGTDDEPNLEAVASLEPDLIIGRLDLHGRIYEDLTRIAPTVLFQHTATEGGPSRLEIQERNFMGIADALNRHDKGVEILETRQARYQELASQLQAAGLNGSKYILAETFFDQPEEMRIYESNFPTGEVLQIIGLENAAVPPVGTSFNQWGESNLGLEGIAALDGPDVHFFHGARHGERGGDVIGTYYNNNPVWQNLEFVKVGQVYNIGNIWMTGGVHTTMTVAERVVDALIGQQMH
jgi:ABC-type Fe3+-hydroxamate transport system substrate-binding protein